MGWFWQIFLQGCALAVLSAVAIYAGWLPLRIGAGIVILWILWQIGRNPLFFYRRLLRMLLLAAIPFILMGLEFEASGRTVLPWGGDLLFRFGQGGPGPVAVLIALAVICLAGDGLLTYLEARRRERLLPETTQRADLFLKRNGQAEIVKRLAIKAPESLTLTGATLHMPGPWPRNLRCAVHVPAAKDGEPQIPITPGNGLRLAGGELRELRVSSQVPAGRYARWLHFRTTAPILGWFPLHILLSLETSLPKSGPTMPLSLSAVSGA